MPIPDISKKVHWMQTPPGKPVDCSVCGWEGYESELHHGKYKDRTLCPKCGNRIYFYDIMG